MTFAEAGADGGGATGPAASTSAKNVGQVSRVVSPNDEMLRADDHDLERYLRNGRQAVEVVSRFVEAPRSILDFGCGHGRVLRFIVAAFPQAEIWACDINADGVSFCQKEFGVNGIVSSPYASETVLPRFDLIWVGSVFTHLPLGPWREFLGLLARSLDGTLAFSVSGPLLAERLRGGESMGVPEDAILADYDTTGFGHHPYRVAPHGYGLTLITPARVKAEAEAVGLSVVEHLPQGWMRQDMVIAR